MATITGTLTADGSTEVLIGEGVLVQCLFKGDFGGGIVELEVSQDDGATWFGTGDKFNTNVSFLTDPFKAKYRFTLSGATSPSINYVLRGR